MLLVIITINAVDFKVSNEQLILETPYNAKVASFTPPNYATDKRYGGYTSLSYGKISFTPDLFEDDWPPPIDCDIAVYYTDTTEAAKELFFDGTAFISDIAEDEITYNLFAPTFDIDLLDTITDYNGDIVSLPRAFGDVVQVNPIRIPDVGGNPTYHLGYITGTKAVDWHVFDDGVNIDTNVTDNADGTFSLSATPVGEVTMSGSNSETDVDAVFTWACGASFLNLTLDSSDSRGTSPTVGYWADSQTTLISFLSELSAYYTHFFRITGSTLFLVDMETTVDTRNITEYDFFPSNYEYKAPIKLIKSEWILRVPGQWSLVGSPGTPAGVYVKDVPQSETVVSSYPYALQEMNLTPFYNNYAAVTSALVKILTILHKPVCKLKIPLAGDLPLPGEEITWTHEALIVDTDATFICRNIRYDYDNFEIEIEGEGALSI